MKSKFPNARIRDIVNYYKGAFPKNRCLTRTAYVELSSAEVRREVLEAIGGGNDKTVKVECYVGGAEVNVKKAATEHTLQRNAALRRASDLLKTDARAHGRVVNIEWLKERGITVDKVYACQQSSTDFTGQFVGAFADLRLP